MAADTTGGARTLRDATTGQPVVRQPPARYVGRHRLVHGDDTPTMPHNLWFKPQHDLSDATTEYLPRIGALDDDPTIQIHHDEDGLAAEKRLLPRQCVRAHGQISRSCSAFWPVYDGYENWR